MKYYKDLKKLTKGKILLNEPLSRHTTFRIGGPAAVWVEPEGVDELRSILKFVKSNRIPFFVIGGGSNLLINDKGFKGVVISLNSDFFKKIKFANNYVSVGSALSLNRLVRKAKENSLGGCEFLSGIPGSVGGALAMNAGTRRNSIFKNHYQAIGDLVKEVDVMDSNGRLKTLKKHDINFGYRYSNLGKFIIISTKLKLNRKNKNRISHEINEFLKYKRASQDLLRPSAGCIFKNPRILSNNKVSSQTLSAGYLIDAAGLKRYRYGGAAISQKHANYIVNDKGASAKDVLKIMRLVQKRIREKFSISLEPEIKIIQTK